MNGSADVPDADPVPLPARRPALPFAEFAAWRADGGGADPQLADELASTLTDTTETV